MSMLSYIRKVADVRKDDGASAVEYGLLVAAIAALIVIIVFALGGLVKGIFKNTCDKIATSGGAGTSASCAP
jgi:pilus assembly protein Flp/PilA